MRSPKDTILAQKALLGTRRRAQARESKLLVETERRNHAQVVHTRKLLVEQGSTKKRTIPRSLSVASLGSTSKPTQKKHEFTLADDAEVYKQMNKFNVSMSLSRSQSNPNILSQRKESERSVLKLAYKIRASANKKPLSELPGQVTSREYAKSSLRNTLRQLREESLRQMERPKTSNGRVTSAAPFDLTFNAGASTRPMSALPFRRTVSGDEDDSGEYDNNKRHSTSALDPELTGVLHDYNQANMISTLTINADVLGTVGIPVRGIKIANNAVPPEPSPPDATYKTTHLHRLRMGYLTGEGHKFREVVARNERQKVRRENAQRPSTTGGSRNRRGVLKPMWKPHGTQGAWRPSPLYKL